MFDKLNIYIYNIRLTLRKYFFCMSKWFEWHCGKIRHSNMTKKVKRHSISVDEINSVYIYIYIYIYVCVCMYTCNILTWTLETCCVTPKYCLSLCFEPLLFIHTKTICKYSYFAYINIVDALWFISSKPHLFTLRSWKASNKTIFINIPIQFYSAI